MKKCKYHCDYGDGEYCHYEGESGCVNIEQPKKEIKLHKKDSFSLSAISKPRFTANDIHVDDYPQTEVIIQKFSRKLIVNKDGYIEYSDIVVKE